MKRPITIAEELEGIEEALAQVAEVSGALQEALKRLAALVRATAEPPLMPNYQRAEEQLRTALNATLGAEKSLRRRLDLRRKLAARNREPDGRKTAARRNA